LVAAFAGVVIPAGGAGVGVAGVVLDIAEAGAGVECQSDRGASKGVRRQLIPAGDSGGPGPGTCWIVTSPPRPRTALGSPTSPT
jgi:hypothetical protein